MLKVEEQSSQQNIISKEDIAVTVDAVIAPGKYKKRQHLVEAMFYNGINKVTIIQWMKKKYEDLGRNFIPWYHNQKSSKTMVIFEDYEIYLEPNHWLVFGHTHRFYILPSDLFEDTYEISND